MNAVVRQREGKKAVRASPSYAEAMATVIMAGMTTERTIIFMTVERSELSVCVSGGRQKSEGDFQRNLWQFK